MRDDLHDDLLGAAMRAATEGMTPRDDAAHRAADRVGAVRRRNAVLGAASTLVLVGGVLVGGPDLWPGASLDRIATVAAAPTGAGATLHPVLAPMVGPACPARTVAWVAPSAALQQLTLPASIPGYPVRPRDDFLAGISLFMQKGAYQEKSFQRSRQPQVAEPEQNGHGVLRQPGPTLLISVIDGALCFQPDARGRIETRRVVGHHDVLGFDALVLDGSDRFASHVGLRLVTNRFSVIADGLQGVTLTELATAVEAISGLDASATWTPRP